MALDPLLIGVIACPVDRLPLQYFEADGLLYNPRLKRTYRIEGAIPVLMPDEATELTDAEAQVLDAKVAAGEARQTGGAATDRHAGR